ncbi:Glycosyltransferase involved in cell wall bisynthesis [Paenibacillus tianmuensis]|uniref:Glycosyltransferase involved in cell wall bisynthesis n=1 Tax=Paenibacillus tianmuensis TaxID=624147 RepID=A0A1G4R604_9BACL|nr:glycosyltransferase family 4 protein [Paenibacillus tianmuensis]SCW52187.1 Glycosyltransferase involved in cell wall bisynthesis [Paenibacillus tianmuensis]
MKQKVLFITNIPSPYRVDFFNALGKHCELTVWFQAKNESNREWEVEGLGTHFNYKFLPGRTFGLDKHINPSVLRELRKSRFDLYVMGCYSSPTEMMAIQWLRMNGIPFILNSDGGFPAPEESAWKRKLKTRFISSASFWLSTGVNCTRYLQYYGAKPALIHEYPISSVSYTSEQLRPLRPERTAELKMRHGLNKFVFLSVGQFIERKGFDVLLRSFRELNASETSLLLIGGGPQEVQYKAYIQEHGMKNVVLLPFVQKNALIDYFKLADAFVLPTRYDVWGLVLNEALMFGLPLISTLNAGAAYDLIENGGNGFTIPAEDAGALTEACRAILRGEEERSRYRSRSLDFASRFTVDCMVESHLDAFERFLRIRKGEAVG